MKANSFIHHSLPHTLPFLNLHFAFAYFAQEKRLANKKRLDEERRKVKPNGYFSVLFFFLSKNFADESYHTLQRLEDEKRKLEEELHHQEQVMYSFFHASFFLKE